MTTSCFNCRLSHIVLCDFNVAVAVVARGFRKNAEQNIQLPYAGLNESLTKKNNIYDMYNNEKNVPLSHMLIIIPFYNLFACIN